MTHEHAFVLLALGRGVRLPPEARTEPEGLGAVTANGATRGDWSWQLPGTQDPGQIGQATHSPPTPYGRFPP